jgi:Right handed beta helix region
VRASGIFVVVVGAIAACYNPTAAPDVPCSADLMCPEGQTCDTTRSPPTCVTELVPIDAPPDMMVDVCGGTCTGDNPVCDPGTTQCRACAKDSECASDVCSESTGRCIDEAAALYVSPTGLATGTCSRAAPCATLSYAAGLLDTTHAAIKVADGTYSDVILTNGLSYLISGEGNSRYGARINFKTGVASRDHVLEVQGGTVVVEGVTFADSAAQENVRAQSNANLTLWRVEVLDSANGGIDIATATVTVLDSRLTGGMGTEGAINASGGTVNLRRTQIDHNAGGGIHTSNGTKFDIENCFILQNGGNGAFVQTGSLPSLARFELNTVADNIATAGTGGGATCAAAIAFKSTLFSNNGGTPQFGATCTATYSLFTDAAPTGTGNITNAVPGFQNADYHLANGSPAIDKADPATSITEDIDGDPRPAGAGYDIGADEH